MKRKIRKVEEEVQQESQILINPNGGPNLSVEEEENDGNSYLNNDELGINDLDGRFFTIIAYAIEVTTSLIKIKSLR